MALAVNRKGKGALHLTLDWRLGSQWRHIDPDYGYGLMKKKLVLLLRAGCPQDCTDNAGYTPEEQARLSPHTLRVWREALEESAKSQSPVEASGLEEKRQLTVRKDFEPAVLSNASDHADVAQIIGLGQHHIWI
ncbi:MAG: hypothetical protein Q9220_003645 [cf. Caloplaca sp. 1 TL-2023]